jgi:hypothetical protein
MSHTRRINEAEHMLKDTRILDVMYAYYITASVDRDVSQELRNDYEKVADKINELGMLIREVRINRT